jgi:hypothetical protein
VETARNNGFQTHKNRVNGRVGGLATSISANVYKPFPHFYLRCVIITANTSVCTKFAKKCHIGLYCTLNTVASIVSFHLLHVRGIYMIKLSFFMTADYSRLTNIMILVSIMPAEN